MCVHVVQVFGGKSGVLEDFRSVGLFAISYACHKIHLSIGVELNLKIGTHKYVLNVWYI